MRRGTEGVSSTLAGASSALGRAGSGFKDAELVEREPASAASELRPYHPSSAQDEEAGVEQRHDDHAGEVFAVVVEGVVENCWEAL